MGIMDKGTVLFREVGSDYSIALYWVIACCGWVRGGVLGCPDPEAVLGVRTYFLRKSWRMSSSKYLRRLTMDDLMSLTRGRSGTFLL